jgi:hypothetical protein
MRASFLSTAWASSRPTGTTADFFIIIHGGFLATITCTARIPTAATFETASSVAPANRANDKLLVELYSTDEMPWMLRQDSPTVAALVAAKMKST